MTDLFLDKYRIKSTRKSGHDYTSPGAYFITINTDAQINWFGSIVNGIMRLSAIGEIVRDEWLKSEELRDNIQLDEWIIMPNHIHGIIKIKERSVETARRAVSFSNDGVSFSTEGDKNQHRKRTLKPNSIGSIIGQFKSICTKRIRMKGNKYFKWQDRYYDHIIRDEKELNLIRYYIRINPIRF
jgi:REP element-mobilizing transposase RayT